MNYESPYNERRRKQLESMKKHYNEEVCKEYAENRIQDYIATLEDENVRLQKEKQELLEQLVLMVKMCKSIGTFENGVKWRGMDEGEMQAQSVIYQTGQLIKNHKGDNDECK